MSDAKHDNNHAEIEARNAPPQTNVDSNDDHSKNTLDHHKVGENTTGSFTRRSLMGINLPSAQELFPSTYWLALSAVILILILKLSSAYYYGIIFSDFIQFVALTTLATSVILLVGDLAGVKSLPPTIRAGIMTSFVLSVLGSSAAVVARAWAGDADNLSVRLILLDELKVSHKMPENVYCTSSFDKRQSSFYPLPKGPEFSILTAVVLRNFRVNPDKSTNITGNIILASPNGLSEYAKLSDVRITSVDYWKFANPKCPKDVSKIMSDLQITDKDMLLLKYIDELKPAVIQELASSKRAVLSVSVVDHSRGIAAQSEDMNLTFR